MSRRIQLAACLVLLSIFATAPFFPAASAAPAPTLSVTPNYINFGMTTTIGVVIPATGSYTVVVTEPNGVTVPMSIPNVATGQTASIVFGSATTGFATLVNQVGTYGVALMQGTTLVAQTSFQATNQILITSDFIAAGYCNAMASGARGDELLYQVHATYASNGQPIAMNASSGGDNAVTNGDVVTFTLPDGTTGSATFHASAATGWPEPWFQGTVWPNWNSSWVTNSYQPTVTAKDGFGNVGTYSYAAADGYAFVISPATLQQAITFNDAATGKLVAGLVSNENVTITANIQYLTSAIAPAGTGSVSGFNGPLDSATRGGVVTAQVGWGNYNTTSNTFTSIKNHPGGLIANVPMTYSTTTKVWTGTFNTGTLPALVNATTYTVMVNSHDKASPPNTGSSSIAVPPASALSIAQVTATPSTVTVTATGAAAASTVTSTSISTLVSTAVSTATSTLISTITSTALSTVSSIATSITTATATTVSVAVSTFTQTISAVPGWAYAAFTEAMVIILIVGVVAGYILRRPKKASP